VGLARVVELGKVVDLEAALGKVVDLEAALGKVEE
jgi:hypothetical protein